MRLRTVGIILSFALGLLSAPHVFAAEQPVKLPRLGYISPGDVPRFCRAYRTRAISCQARSPVMTLPLGKAW